VCTFIDLFFEYLIVIKMTVTSTFVFKIQSLTSQILILYYPICQCNRCYRATYKICTSQNTSVFRQQRLCVWTSDVFRPV